MIHHDTDIAVLMPPHSLNNHTTRPCWDAGRTTRIGVIGAGELGLRTAVEFAERGFEVVCADLGAELPASDALAESVERSRRSGRLRLTPSSADAARHGQVIVMAICPPAGSGGARSTARELSEAATEVARNLAGPAVVIDKTSTSEASADWIARLMARHSNHEIVVISGSQTSSRRNAVRVFLRSELAAAAMLHRWG